LGQDETQYTHLTLDWLARKLYWAVEATSSDTSRSHKFGIMRLDLVEQDMNKTGLPEWVIKSQSPIRGIAVNPYERCVFL